MRSPHRRCAPETPPETSAGPRARPFPRLNFRTARRPGAADFAARADLIEFMVAAVATALQEGKMVRGKASYAAAWDGAGVVRTAWAAALVAAIALLAACSDTTPYRPAARGEGYRDQQVAPGRYQVSFIGNTVTDQQTVEDYMMYRAAEVTVNAGKDRFTVLEKDVERISSEQVIFESRGGRGQTDGDRALGRDDSYSRPVHRFRAAAVIQVAGGEGPAPDGLRTFDARALMARLAPRVGRADRS